jgi:hypothetical protein
MKSWHGRLAALLVLVFAWLSPALAAVDSAVCSATDLGAGTCSGSALISTANEEITAARRLGAINLISVAGTNTITATTAPSTTSLQDGQLFKLKPAANNSGAATLNISTIGAKPVVSSAGTALGSDDLQASTVYLIEYYQPNDLFRVLTPLGTGVASASSPFITIGNTGSLASERAITPDGTTITGTDGGANASYGLSLTNNGVSNAKLAQMPANTLKGNNTGAVANAADLTVAQTKTLLGLATVASSGSASDLGTGTLPAAAMPALTGEVTTTVGTVATTIAGNAVTNGKLATAPANTLKGNNTGSAASPSDLTAAQVKTLLALTPGTDIQAFDSDLSALAATASTGLYNVTGAGTSATVSTSAGLRGVLSDETGTGAAMFGLTAAMANDLGCTASQAVRRNVGGTAWECYTVSTGAGTGDVVGPAGATDMAIALFDTTTGKALKNSTLTVDAAGALTRTASTTLPAAPAANATASFGWLYSGLPGTAQRSNGRSPELLQPLLARNPPAIWMAPGNSTTVPGIFGMPAPTALGTATTRSVATTNVGTRSRRLGYVSTTGLGTLGGNYMTVAQFTTGTGTSGVGGFLYITRFMVSDAATVTGARMFVGLRNAVAAPTNVEPSTLTNQVGACQISSSTNLQICYGGSAAQTPIDLGVNFPAATLSADYYELTLYSPTETADKIYYRVERIGTAFIAEGLLTGTAGTAFPSNTTLLGHTVWRTNNATALAVGIDIASLYIETEN